MHISIFEVFNFELFQFRNLKFCSFTKEILEKDMKNLAQLCKKL